MKKNSQYHDVLKQKVKEIEHNCELEKERYKDLREDVNRMDTKLDKVVDMTSQFVTKHSNDVLKLIAGIGALLGIIKGLEKFGVL